MKTYKQEIEIWDNYSKFHIVNSTSIINSMLQGRQDIVVVDVGANSGTYFDELDKNLDIKKAILFEMEPHLYEYLCEKYREKPYVKVENIALSNSCRKYSINNTTFLEQVETNVGNQDYNLGLSYINYNENSDLVSNSFDNLRNKYNLERIDLLKIDTETEDLLVLQGFTQTIKNLKVKPIIEFECNWWIKYSREESQEILDRFCTECGYLNNIDLDTRGDFFLYPEQEQQYFSADKSNSNFTLVTGLWDLKRGDLEGWAKRDFQHYKERFFELLETDVPMCIWVPDNLRQEVLNRRKNKPTKIYTKNIEDFKTWNPFFEKIQEIRKNPNWCNIAGWLPESPQAALEYYNPMMFTKMFMLNDSSIMNPFETEYFFWIDGGLTNTVPKGYFTYDKVLENLPNYVKVNDKKFLFISYPYEANNEIHGFERNAIAKYCNTDFVKYVCRGGFFGGHKDKIRIINDLYYGIMKSTLDEGFMGADECLFTILSHRHSDLVTRFEIEGNGLVWPFFEELKKYNKEDLVKNEEFLDIDNVGLYVLTFNSPKQFETLIKSFELYDKEFLSKPKKFLLDNSTDSSTFDRYKELCDLYKFEHIKKDNLGICGGRQWIAEHADENSFDFYFFFEDDMFFYNGKDKLCQNGFTRNVKNLYKNSIEIVKDNKFDFLKLNYTEFFGDNGTQWSWYNIPQSVREEFFPDKTKLPVQGRDPDAPKTLFKNIRSYKSIPFVDGDIYYSNWPQVVTRPGNKKMFLTEKWAYPYEQTWMSYIFQQTKKNRIRPGLLLATPTEHNRFEHYDGKLRKES